jgi:hypothetical protein
MGQDLELAGSLSDGVAAWRQARLLDAGFEAGIASEFAHRDEVDLHELLDLVDRGCPPRLAARIRAPIDRRGGAR